MKVTRSLAQCLKALRFHDKSRLLWVDQICINQADNQERAQQVSLMGNIYSSAAYVTAWLGPQADNSQYIAEISEDLSSGCHLTDLRSGTCRDWPMAEELFSQLPSRPWWRRQWVLQEVVLNENVTFRVGDAWFSLELLSKAASNAERHVYTCCRRYHKDLHPNHPLNLIQSFSNDIADYRLVSKGRDINTSPVDVSIPMSVLLMNPTRLCADKRDKLYSILGIGIRARQSQTQSPISQMKPLVPDYGRSMRDLFVQETIRFLRHRNDTRVFGYLNTIENRDTTLPSWRLDPCYDYESFRTIKKRCLHQFLFNACGPHTVLDFRLIDDRFLHIKGSFYDTVQKVSHVSSIPAGTTSRSSAHQLFEVSWRDFVQQGCSNQRWATYDCTITWSVIPRRDSPTSAVRSSAGVEREINQWRKWLLAEIDEERPGFLPTLNDVLHNRITDLHHDQRLFITEKGLLGSGPRDVEVGDRIAIFASAKMPNIRRKSDGRYKLVGTCYIHHIMDGQAMVQQRLKRFWIQSDGITVPFDEESTTKMKRFFTRLKKKGWDTEECVQEPVDLETIVLE